MRIGCIGQGFVGKSISDDLENRGYQVVRYSLEDEYINNKDAISHCELVFIGVPTPTTPNGFEDEIVKEAISLVSDEAIIVIKSTILPGTTKKLQQQFPNKVILFSPEFLCERTAAYDVANPIMNIIGITKTTKKYKKAAETVLSIIPKSDHVHIVSVESAEIIKYAHNLNGYFRIILSNLLFEVSESVGGDWTEIKKMMDDDVMMSPYYNEPVHKGGRGAGGNCFIKDMAAFRHLYANLIKNDPVGLLVLETLERKNMELLKQTGKNQDLVKSVYGENK